VSDISAPRSRHWIRWTLLTCLAVLLAATGWVAIRGGAAAADLQQVRDSASAMRTSIAAGKVDDAARDARALTEHAASARDRTSDPIWRTFEILPWLGPNLTAVREVSQIADRVASGAVQPLLTASKGISLTDLGFHDGVLDLAPFSTAEPSLAEADRVFSQSSGEARRIKTEALIPQLTDSVMQLRTAIDEAASVVGALHGAAALMPTMLGGEGPRTYVVAMLNNAELRSAGGIIGAMAEVRADHGTLTMIRQASTADFTALDVPLPLSASTVALFDDKPGRYIQNLTSVPDFSAGAPAIAARWTERFGTPVDGVIAIDTVVAQHLLTVTGSQKVGPLKIDANNALTVLLSDVYRTVPDPVMQDAVFAATAAVLFDAGLHGGDAKALIRAVAESTTENRIRIWSAHTDEQRILAGSSLGGALPTDTADSTAVGVLLNDTTGGKMDFYARARISISAGMCAGTPTTRVRVTWSNDVPAGAVGTLPPYVTGGGWFGVTPGETRTLIAVYGPQGATVERYDRDGAEQPVQTAELDGRFTVQHSVTLAPGESTTITVDFVGKGAGRSDTTTQHTPMAFGPEIASTPLRCRS
jgi:hypothetical protein